jgi:hypothetical protein
VHTMKIQWGMMLKHNSFFPSELDGDEQSDLNHCFLTLSEHCWYPPMNKWMGGPWNYSGHFGRTLNVLLRSGIEPQLPVDIQPVV